MMIFFTSGQFREITDQFISLYLKLVRLIPNITSTEGHEIKAVVIKGRMICELELKAVTTAFQAP